MTSDPIHKSFTAGTGRTSADTGRAMGRASGSQRAGTRRCASRRQAGVLAIGSLVLTVGQPAPRSPGFGVRPVPGMSWVAMDGTAALSDDEIPWRSAGAGIAVAEMQIGDPNGWAGSVILTRIDPRAVRATLTRRTTAGGTLGAWRVEDARADAVVAFNAGQFEGGLPWGWVVAEGIERRPPGLGPLSTAVVFDTLGAVTLIAWKDIPARRFAGDMAFAFQSYPTVLAGGDLPEPLRSPGSGVDLEHRDIRLAFGIRPDGTVLVALTRFFDTAGVSLPFGPTVPEMALLMKAFGARDAVLLDGGLSAQLRVHTPDGDRDWSALRAVPLALEMVPRN